LHDIVDLGSSAKVTVAKLSFFSSSGFLTSSFFSSMLMASFSGGCCYTVGDFGLSG